MISLLSDNDKVAWEVEVSDEFAQWYRSLDEDESESVDTSVGSLAAYGPMLGRPDVDTLKGSRHRNLKELRVRHQGWPLRILFAFDPRRCAYLILGGDKTGDGDWYVSRSVVPRRSMHASHRDWRMIMAQKWSDIRRKHAPEVEERIRRKVAAKGMTLNQLRQARQLTQVNLAETLKINQGAVSMMEKRTDMYVSTLRNYIEAMGGELKITAELPEGAIQIEQFENVIEA